MAVLVTGGRREGGAVEERELKGRSIWEEGCSMMEEGRLIVLDGRDRVLRL